MHRHGYKGKKFHREVGARKALVKNLAESLVVNKSIETTLPRAKEVSRYVERLITKAKKGDLHNRRQVISGLDTISTANILVDQIAPQLTSRTSGHLRVKRTKLRRGDNAQMAKLSFVDEIKATTIATKQKSTVKATPKAKTTTPKTEQTKPKTSRAIQTKTKSSAPGVSANRATVSHRRSGEK